MNESLDHKFVDHTAPSIGLMTLMIVAILCFSFWLLHATYYTVDKNGITVKCGLTLALVRSDYSKTRTRWFSLSPM